MASILVTRTLPDAVLSRLRGAAEIDVWAEPQAIPRETLLSRVRGRDALVCLLTDRIDSEVLDAAGPSLRVVANVAVGYNNIDVAACRARHVTVTNTPDVLTNACADFTWGLILAITRRLGEGERVVRAGRWGGWALDYMLGMELRGKQLGIVGLGRIGVAVAEKASAFGMRVAYSGRRPVEMPGAVHLSLEELLRTSENVRCGVAALPEHPGDAAPDECRATVADATDGLSHQYLARAGGGRGGAGGRAAVGAAGRGGARCV